MIKKNNNFRIVSITFFSILIVLILSVFIVDFIHNDFSFKTSSRIKNIYINGIVDTIYTDKSDHNNKKIKIMNFNKTIIHEYLDNFNLDFVSKARKGDTVFSNKQNDTIFIIRNNKKMNVKKSNDKQY